LQKFILYFNLKYLQIFLALVNLDFCSTGQYHSPSGLAFFR